MPAITFLLLLGQASITQIQLPPEAIQALVNATERVTAIGQTASVCQAGAASERSHLAAVRKDLLESRDKLALLQTNQKQHRAARNAAKVYSAEWKAADAALELANAQGTNLTAYLKTLSGDEIATEARLKAQTVCVDGVLKQLEMIRNPKPPY